MTRAKPLILYHAGCADGFCAAWIAHRKFGDDADYLPVNYNEPLPDLARQGGRDLYILDFSYNRETLIQLAQTNHSVTVLDHHKTAQAALKDLQAPGLSITFDMEKSGGRLTWEYFQSEGRPVPPMDSEHYRVCYTAPWLVDYTEDRDLWRWKLPASKEVSATLASYQRDFKTWTMLYELARGKEIPPVELCREGAAILRYQAQLVESAVANAVEIEMDGHKVLAVNATCLVSEICERLAKDRPFGASYFIHGDGRKIWSLRSREGGIDVSEVAKRHGGGGHKAASGFTEAKP
jgi:oligoribonuclease NrnB/cAMP/cGMP phosphodiesterase (DHH superfamily)